MTTKPNNEFLELSIGDGQSWSDVSGSRVAGTTYTNSTGRPIFVSVSLNPDTSERTLSVDGVVVASSVNSPDSVSTRDNLAAIVPDGSTYEVTSGATVVYWAELR